MPRFLAMTSRTAGCVDTQGDAWVEVVASSTPRTGGTMVIPCECGQDVLFSVNRVVPAQEGAYHLRGETIHA